MTRSAAESSGEQAYQPHHRLIIEQNQVQIYEELTKDAEGRFTTSFLHRAPDVHQTAVIPEKRCG